MTIPAPLCTHCRTPASLTTGAAIYPHRRDLHKKRFWVCPCGARCGCHLDTTVPLGTPANDALRWARSAVHRVLDPIWRDAHLAYSDSDVRRNASRKCIAGLARDRVYRWLADQMGLAEAQCHVGMFDAAQCAEAMRLLRGRTYDEIRAWAKEREK